MDVMTDRRGAGFTLLEVLITLVILSVGLLGVASLQLNSMRYASMSAGRNQAALFAEHLAERIRSNPSADYTASATATSCYAATCSHDQRALLDLAEVREQLQTPSMGGLQNGDLQVNTASGGYVITVNWDETNRFAKSAASATVMAQTLDLYVGVNR